MPTYSHLKKSGGSLIALLLMQGQMAVAAEILPPGKASNSTQAFDVILGSSTVSKADQEISDIEKQYFEHDFRSESIDERLTGIEQLIFGEAKLGTEQERLAAVKKAVKKALSDSLYTLVVH